MSSSTSAIQSIILLYSLLNLQEDSCSYSVQYGATVYFCSAVQILENVASLFLFILLTFIRNSNCCLLSSGIVLCLTNAALTQQLAENLQLPRRFCFQLKTGKIMKGTFQINRKFDLFISKEQRPQLRLLVITSLFDYKIEAFFACLIAPLAASQPLQTCSSEAMNSLYFRLKTQIAHS